MPDLLRLSRCCIGDEEKEAVARVLDVGYLGMGQEVMLFEKEIEHFFSDKVHVACVSTGTAALQLALQASGIGYRAEVIVPSITYVASFQAISATGARPVACDIDLQTGCLNVLDARRKITPQTKAIMYVHYASGVGDRDSIFSLAKEFNLRIIEDAAHSFGGYYKKVRIGEIGDITCFSFDGIKNITCGEGGAVVSSDKALIESIRDLRLLGVKKDTENRYAGKRSWDFDVDEQGWRYHMSNINAAIGLQQIKKIDFFSSKRRHIAKTYMDLLKALPIRFLNLDLDSIVPHIFPILVEKHHKEALKSFLLEHNVETGIHYKPNHLLSKYKDNSCPISEDFYHSVLSLPMHVNMNDDDILRVVSSIKDYYKAS